MPRPLNPDGSQYNSEFEDFKADLIDDNTIRDMGGGRHGGEYARTHNLEVTPGPAFDEIRSRLIEKKADKPSQKAIKKLLLLLNEAGFQEELLRRPEAEKLPPDILLALKDIYSLNLSSLSAASAFYTSDNFSLLAHVRQNSSHDFVFSGINAKALISLKNIFPENIKLPWKK